MILIFDLKKAAELGNSHGGTWGPVGLEKWLSLQTVLDFYSVGYCIVFRLY